MFAEGGDSVLLDEFHAAAAAAGVTPGNAYVPTRDNGTSVFVAEDVDQAWREMGPYLLHDAVTYREWMGDNTVAASRSEATTVDELRAEGGAYRILTVEQAAAQVRTGMPLSMQPLCGGMPPELAWKSLRLAGTAVQATLA
jgi:hypothetical protein